MEDFKVCFAALTKGQLYRIIKAEREDKKFYGKTVNSIKLTLLDDDIEISTYLPKKVAEELSEADFARINAAGATEHKDAVCYYGTIEAETTKSYVGKIHPYGEGKFLLFLVLHHISHKQDTHYLFFYSGVDELKLKKIASFTSKYGKKPKRARTDDEEHN